MLNTSSIKSAKPRKGEVGASSSGKNRAESVGNDEVDGIDDGGGRKSNFNRKFHLSYDSHTTHLNIQDELINELIN